RRVDVPEAMPGPQAAQAGLLVAHMAQARDVGGLGRRGRQGDQNLLAACRRAMIAVASHGPPSVRRTWPQMGCRATRANEPRLSGADRGGPPAAGTRSPAPAPPPGSRRARG